MAEKAGNAGNSRGGHHKRAPRGGAPTKARSRSKTQAQRRELRLTKGRVKDAMADVARNRAWLEAELAKQVKAGEPELLLPAPVATATRTRTKVGTAATVVLTPPDPWREGDDDRWPLGDARALIRDGYHLGHVVGRTGWGEHWFRDLVGRDGYVKAGAAWGVSA